MKKADKLIVLKLEEALRFKINALRNYIDVLTNYVFDPKDVFYKASWCDSVYYGCPSGEDEFKTLEEAAIWLSKEDHPMEFSGCHMSIESVINIGGEEITIQVYDAKKLADDEYYKSKKI